MPNFTKIRPMGGELIHADGQTDRYDGVILAFQNFANASNKTINVNFSL